jgi:hypothetical protein
MSAINTVDAGIYLEELEKLLKTAKSRKQLYQTIVDAPFHNRVMTGRLGLGITVLLLVNEKESCIDRIALARTELARGTVDMSAKPFREIRIPLKDRDNFISIAIRRKHYMITSDWQFLFVPALTPQQARFNQAGGGIACSVVYPLDIKPGGAMIFSYYEPVERIGSSHHGFMRDYCRLVAKCLNSLRPDLKN